MNDAMISHSVSLISGTLTPLIYHTDSTPSGAPKPLSDTGANEPSKALLLALGFTREGTLRQRFYFADRHWDDLYCGLLKAAWRI
jgi:hypothetical protein